MFSYNFGIYMMVAVVLLFESSLQPVRVGATIRLLSLLLYFSTFVEEFCYSMQPFYISPIS